MKNLGKYVIVYLLSGEAAKLHREISGKIAEEFSVPKVSDKIDPHVTLKYFNQLLDTKQIGELENKIESFCKRHKRTKIKLEGVGNFGEGVIFMDVIPSRAMTSLYSALVEELDSLNWIQWNKYDRKGIHFHSTIAEGDVGGHFKEAYGFASKFRPSLEVDMDNITILTKPRDKWIVYRQFILN